MLASEVLSTFPNPICAFVTLCGLLVLEVWLLKLVCVAYVEAAVVLSNFNANASSTCVFVYVVDLSAFRFNAVCCAVLTGLSASLVLSTLLNPTWALVTLCGLLVLEVCAFRFVIVAYVDAASVISNLSSNKLSTSVLVYVVAADAFEANASTNPAILLCCIAASSPTCLSNIVPFVTCLLIIELSANLVLVTLLSAIFSVTTALLASSVDLIGSSVKFLSSVVIG